MIALCLITLIFMNSTFDFSSAFWSKIYWIKDWVKKCCWEIWFNHPIWDCIMTASILDVHRINYAINWSRFMMMKLLLSVSKLCAIETINWRDFHSNAMNKNWIYEIIIEYFFRIVVTIQSKHYNNNFFFTKQLSTILQ